jgi:RsiW-degrading membrane proteinase PrsW (M82 family)
VAGVISVLGGLLLALVTVVSDANGSGGLATIGQLVGLVLFALPGGVVATVNGILVLIKRPSLRFFFPPAWLFFLLSLAAVGGGVVIWNRFAHPGPLVAVLPLVVASGLLPALTVLALASARLGYPSTWRHVTLSLIYGGTIAGLVASILNTLAYVAIVLLLQALGFNISLDLNFLQNLNPTNAAEAVAFLLLGSVAAPLVEEGLKPLGAVLLMPRLRGPNEAFLVGMAAGIGFAVVETLGYIGMGEADWVAVAVQRLGAGLVHGVGAGMGAMGWYYLIRGKGVPLRWLRGFGSLGYAVVQHSLFNGSNLLGAISPVGQLLGRPFYLGSLPIDAGTAVAFVFYLLILTVLVVVTGRLRLIKLATPAAPAGPRASRPIGGGAR